MNIFYALVLGSFISVSLVSCKPKPSWEAHRVIALEEHLLQQAKTGFLDTAALNRLLVSYDLFMEKYPDDVQSAEFLFKAADFYRYLQRPLRSVSCYEKIYDNFPNYEKRPYALLLQGFILENEVQNYTAAKVKYELFLKEYPDSPMAHDVAIALKNMGKTPEQLVEEFKQQQAQTNP